MEEKQNPETNEEKIDKKKQMKDKCQKLNEEIDKLKADANHWQNEYYKAFADTQNLRKSLEKDYREALKYRSEGFVSDLLPILDGFYLALQTEPSTPEIKNYLIGFQYIYKNLQGILANEGVKEVSPKIGDKFDAHTMHAVDTEISDGPENIIVRIHANGYMLHDHMIRPAMVVVSKKAKQEEENSSAKLDA